MGTLTVISVYAPTNEATGQDKDAFYLQLSSVVEGCRTGETPLLLGNARVDLPSKRVMGTWPGLTAAHANLQKTGPDSSTSLGATD